MQYHRMRFAVGIFVIVSSVLFMVLTYVILLKKGVFEDKAAFSFYTRSADTIYIGMPIRYSGFEIGSITNITLTESGQVHVLFNINKKHMKWVRRKTVLQLEKPLLGSPAINLLTSLADPEAEAGATLQFIVQDDINDIIKRIEPVVKDLQNIVISLNSMLSELASEDGDLFKSLANFETYSSRLVENKALLTTLTGDDNVTITVKETLTELNRIVKDLHANVITPSGTTVEQLNAILEDIKKKLDTLDGTVSAIGSYDEDLLELKGDIRTGMQKTNNLLDRVNAILGDAKPEEAPLP